MPGANSYPEINAFPNETYINVFINSSNKGKKMPIETFAFAVLKKAQEIATEIDVNDLTSDFIVNVISPTGNIVYKTSLDNLLGKFLPQVKDINIATQTSLSGDGEAQRLYIDPDVLDLTKIVITAPIVIGGTNYQGIAHDDEDGNLNFSSYGSITEGTMSIVYRLK